MLTGQELRKRPLVAVYICGKITALQSHRCYHFFEQLLQIRYVVVVLVRKWWCRHFIERLDMQYNAQKVYPYYPSLKTITINFCQSPDY